MSTREERANKRNEAKTDASVAKTEASAAAQKSEKQTSKTRKKKSPIEEVSVAEAQPLTLTSEKTAGPSLISIIYDGGDSEPERQLVILPYGVIDEYWRNANIVYFRSSGTSNENCGWLCGTFFPTGGITTKIISEKTTEFNSECRDTGGHLLKMSDIVNNVGTFIGIEPFSLALANVLGDIIYSEPVFQKTIKPPEFDNYSAGPSIQQVFDAFNAYFISEQQLILSYQLTPPNIGLWGWRFGNFSLAKFCQERWGMIPHIMVPPLSVVDKLNKEDTCNFIKRYGASVDLDILRDSLKRLHGKLKRSKCNGEVTIMVNVFAMKGRGIHKRTQKRKNKRNNPKKTKQQYKKR